MNGRKASVRVALIGLMAATIECGKLALAALPNIEVVTILCALYGYVFGIYGVIAAVIFVIIEPLIYGAGTWIVSYILYWPLVALVFMLLGRIRLRSRWLLTLAALLLTLWFGVLSSLVDVGLFMGYFEDFLPRFAIQYTRGLPFYATQLACNAALFLFLFGYIEKNLSRVARKLLK